MNAQERKGHIARLRSRWNLAKYKTDPDPWIDDEELAAVFAELDRLSIVNTELLAACEQAEDCIDRTAKGGELALQMIKTAIANAEANQ